MKLHRFENAEQTSACCKRPMISPSHSQEKPAYDDTKIDSTTNLILLLGAKQKTMQASPISMNQLTARGPVFCGKGKKENNDIINMSSCALDDINLQEDNTCFLLTLKIPRMRGWEVTLHDDNTVHICGYRRCNPNSGSFPRHKRQRIGRQFPIDPDLVDLERSMARVWNGCLTLYAPKKQHRSEVSVSFSDE